MSITHPASRRAALGMAALALLATTACQQANPPQPANAPAPASTTVASSSKPSAATAPSAQAMTPEQMQQALKRKWMLVGMGSFTRDQLVAAKAFMDLTQLPQAVANAGCNDLLFSPSIGTLTAQADGAIQASWKVADVASTRMACNDMAPEQKLAATLKGHSQLRINGHELTLSGGGDTLRFIAADWD